MARTLTINSVNTNPDGTANVVFTMSGLAIGAMNKQYSVNNLPVDTKFALFTAIRQYLLDHAKGLQTVQAPTQGAAVTAIVSTPVDLDQSITPGT